MRFVVYLRSFPINYKSILLQVTTVATKKESQKRQGHENNRNSVALIHIREVKIKSLKTSAIPNIPLRHIFQQKRQRIPFAA